MLEQIKKKIYKISKNSEISSDIIKKYNKNKNLKNNSI